MKVQIKYAVGRRADGTIVYVRRRIDARDLTDEVTALASAGYMTVHVKVL